MPMSQRFLATLSGGPGWYEAGQTKSFYLQPGYNNTYFAIKPTHVLASGEFFMGLQQGIFAHTYGQLGIAIATSSDATLQGHIWQLADPIFDNFSYQYKINHSHLALKGKLLSDVLSSTCLPYLSGSVGVGLNRSFLFSMTSFIFEALPQAEFSSHTETSLTYTVGAGIQQSLNQHWQLGIGYELTDWGSSALSRAAGQTMNGGLFLNHLYINQLQLSLSYLS